MSASSDPLSRIVRHLDASDAPADQAAACATIAILCSQPTPPENLEGVCEKLLKLLDDSEAGVKVQQIIISHPILTINAMWSWNCSQILLFLFC